MNTEKCLLQANLTFYIHAYLYMIYVKNYEFIVFFYLYLNHNTYIIILSIY